jgi:hypothetical protein
VLDCKTSDIRIGDEDEVQPLFQSLLKTLADLDFDYERERKRVISSTEDPVLKSRLLSKLRERHRERREPYIQHLTILQERLMPA